MNKFLKSIAGNYCRNVICTGMVFMAVMGWWGVLYPQLSLNRDTYRIVSEDGTVQTGEDMVEWKSGDTVYMEILNAESGRVPTYPYVILEILPECLTGASQKRR